MRPAIYDGHVKPLAWGQLDDLFGVKRTGFAKGRILEGQMRLPDLQLTENRPLDLPKLCVDPGVTVVTARAWGQADETPLLLVNEFGKGQTVLLNLAMASYPALSAEANAARTIAEWERGLPALKLKALLNEI